MNVKQLKQELTQRGLLTDGLKAVLVERLTKAMAWKNSNVAFHSCAKQVQETAAGLASAEEDVAALEDQLAEIQAELDAARQRIPVLKREEREAVEKTRLLSWPLCEALNLIVLRKKAAGMLQLRAWREKAAFLIKSDFRQYDNTVD